MFQDKHAVASTGTKKRHLTADKETTICGYRIEEILPQYEMPEADCQRCWRIYEQRTGEGAPVDVGTGNPHPYVLDADIADEKLLVSIVDGERTLNLSLTLDKVREMAEHLLEVRYEGQTILVPASEVYRAIKQYETKGEVDETPITAPSG